MPDIDARTALGWVNSGEAVLVDVRSAGEFAGGHAPQALHVPLGQLNPKALPNSTKKLVLICASGMRSSAGCDVISPHGFEAWSVAGGMSAWQRAGGAVVAEPGATAAQNRKLMAFAVLALGIALSVLVHPGFLVLAAVAGAHVVKAMLPPASTNSSCATGGPGQTACSTPGVKGKTAGCAGCGAKGGA